MPDPVFILDIGPDGVVATHPGRVELPVLVAPIPEPEKKAKFNTVRPHLVPIACMRLHKSGFDFDSSFVGRSAELRFPTFAKLMVRLQQQDSQVPQRFPPCGIFGHADPTGTDGYNKILAGRRALSVYGVLVRDAAVWDELYLNSIGGGDRWGLKSIQTILSVSLKRDSEGRPVTPPEEVFYTGPVDGGKTPQTLKQTREAVLAYENARGLPANFPPGTAVRKQMFLEYMDVLCHFPVVPGDPSSGRRFQLSPETDFIGRHKDGKGLKGDLQGCGDFNPTFRLSKAAEDLAKTNKVLAEVRNELYRVDRRAVVYAFRHGTEIDQDAWPCPRVREGPAKCTLRFWSDHEKRRRAAADDRTFGENMTVLDLDDANNLTVHPVETTGNLMACRFYHAFAVHSPCERKMNEWIVRLKVDSVTGDQVPLANRRYVVKAGEAEFAPVIRGTTSDTGELRIPVLDEETKMIVRIDARETIEPDDQTSSADQKDSAPSDRPDGAPAAAPTSDPGFDSDRFPDEDKFLPMIFDAGVLPVREPDDDPAIKERLYNLGFGQNAPSAWTNQEFANAFSQYRHRHQLDQADDNTVRNDILEEHDLRDEPPPPPDDDDNASVA